MQPGGTGGTNKYCRRRSFTEKLCNRIITLFQREAVLLWGNWGRTPNGLRHQPSTPGIGLRRQVHRRFLTPTTYEGYTSQLCAGCHHRVAEVHHQLLRCDNGNCSNQWWSRDVMGALNIRCKGLHMLQHGEEHPGFRVVA